MVGTALAQGVASIRPTFRIESHAEQEDRRETADDRKAVLLSLLYS